MDLWKAGSRSMTLRSIAEDAMIANVDFPAPRIPTSIIDASGLKSGTCPVKGGKVGEGVRVSPSCWSVFDGAAD